MNFTNIIIHIQIGMANGINMDLSLSKNYEIRSDLPRLTVCKILALAVFMNFLLVASHFMKLFVESLFKRANKIMVESLLFNPDGRFINNFVTF